MLLLGRLAKRLSFQEPASFEVTEGETYVALLTAFHMEGEPLTYSIIGGDDAAVFSIDPMTGSLSFDTPPDFEAPMDVGLDNDYLVRLQATAGTDTAQMDVLVSVLNDPPEYFCVR